MPIRNLIWDPSDELIFYGGFVDAYYIYYAQNSGGRVSLCCHDPGDLTARTEDVHTRTRLQCAGMAWVRARGCPAKGPLALPREDWSPGLEGLRLALSLLKDLRISMNSASAKRWLEGVLHRPARLEEVPLEEGRFHQWTRVPVPEASSATRCLRANRNRNLLALWQPEQGWVLRLLKSSGAFYEVPIMWRGAPNTEAGLRVSVQTTMRALEAVTWRYRHVLEGALKTWPALRAR